MKVIVSREILQNEEGIKEKVLKFINEKEIPSNWAVNVIDGKYVFEYIDSGNMNLFGEVNDDYLEMIGIKEMGKMLVIEKILFKIIEKRFSYDKEFFSNEGFRSTPAAWSRFKNGEVSINDMKYGKVSRMLGSIFTSLEIQIIEKIGNEKINNELKVSEIERYKEIKIDLLKEWIELDRFYAGLSRYSLPNGGQTANYLTVEKDEYNKITFTIIGSSNIPAGKRNRKEWLMKNLDKLDI